MVSSSLMSHWLDLSLPLAKTVGVLGCPNFKRNPVACSFGTSSVDGILPSNIGVYIDDN